MDKYHHHPFVSGVLKQIFSSSWKPSCFPESRDEAVFAAKPPLRAILCICSFLTSMSFLPPLSIFSLISLFLNLQLFFLLSLELFHHLFIPHTQDIAISALSRTLLSSPRLSYYELFHYCCHLLMFFHKSFQLSHFTRITSLSTSCFQAQHSALYYKALLTNFYTSFLAASTT